MLNSEKKIHEIAELLVNSDEIQDQQLSLFSGSTGIAMFLFYYSRIFNKDSYANKANELLFSTINRLDLNRGYTFCEGISGICWTISHLIEKGFIHDENAEVINYFDSFLSNNIVADLKRGNNDFLHGAIGAANYLLKRIQIDCVRKVQEEILELLAKQMQNNDDHYFWNYFVGPNEGIPACNISLSHGMSGTGLFLVKAEQMGFKNNLTRDLLSKTSLFLSAQANSDSLAKSLYPSFSLKHGLSSPWGLYSRLGWCYGDLGIALFFWYYSQLISSIELREKALEVFLFSTKRTGLEENSVFDGGICHGASGIALIFRRMYLNTQLPEFKLAAEYWLDQTLLMAKYNDGLAGYKANKKTLEYGLLEGIAGIGLVLLSFLSDNDQQWDEFLLLS